MVMDHILPSNSYPNVFLIIFCSSASLHTLPTCFSLWVRLFSPYRHFYGLAVDNYMRSGQNIAGIKKSIFIPFLTEARQATFTTHNIRQSFSSTGIYPLNARGVLGKLAPKVPKRRDTFGIIKSPSGSREIRHQVQAAGLLLDKITLGNSHPTMDRVRGIMSSLGHQLEEEIASQEL